MVQGAKTRAGFDIGGPSFSLEPTADRPHSFGNFPASSLARELLRKARSSGEIHLNVRGHVRLLSGHESRVLRW
jgi:hypothetical protein